MFLKIRFQNKMYLREHSTIKCIPLIDDLLTDVYTCRGRVFGDYARNVIFREMFEKSPLPFKTLDIWFSTKEDYDKFDSINDGAVRSKDKTKLQIEWSPDYSYQKVDGDFYYNGVQICPVHIVICTSTIPQILFDVDCLVMGIDVEDEFPNPKVFATGGFKLDHLLKLYENRIAMVIGNATVEDVDRMEGDKWMVVDRDGNIIGSSIPKIDDITNYELDMFK